MNMPKYVVVMHPWGMVLGLMKYMPWNKKREFFWGFKGIDVEITLPEMKIFLIWWVFSPIAVVLCLHKQNQVANL